MSKKPASVIALETLVADLSNQLMQMERDDPAVIPVSRKLDTARRTLRAHRIAVQQCEDKAR